MFVIMSDKTKNNPISFRLSDDDLKRLEILANSFDVPKSTMATNIIENALNENLQEFQVNHISYPRPIIKKLFVELDEKQIILMIATTNSYNKEVIESTKSYHSSETILNNLKKTWKTYGCKIRITKLKDSTVIEIHHELGRNWSKITSATTSFILELLDYKINSTFVTEDWFKVEYSDLDHSIDHDLA